jgi:anoctamin-10
VANLNFKQSGNDGDGVDAVHAGDEGKRDVKVAASIPVIAACGMGLGGLLMGIFVLEAFVGEVYDGFGKEVVVSLLCSSDNTEEHELTDSLLFQLLYSRW